MRQQARHWRARGERIGLVPTMGNLHQGHLKLVEELSNHVDRLVVSVFVNPLQFGPSEDYESYPRTLADDLRALAGYPVDAVFAPSAEQMYPRGAPATTIDLPALTNTLCGADRPGHFAGVALVVAKLFNIVEPDAAAFGNKDYQQLQVIRRLVQDLDYPVEILGVATVREADGLALSSRNNYLDAEQRRVAAELYATLQEMVAELRAGRRDYQQLEAAGATRLRQAGFSRVDYLAIRRSDDLAAPSPADTELVCLGAAQVGAARLIDNIAVRLID
nr:pantoate--beta-alanine ligase [Halorhodospira halochloris]